jgi:UDP-N-acetylglucosamine--N-acetylmuramyl-(pentapeptide) pyrophosphoryl-undecaprenol N-acetylglucosamine transferase
VFTGGGTGGHVFPGLAVLERIRDSGVVDVGWIGATRGMERAIVRERSVPFYGVPVGKLRRYVSLRNLWDVFRVAAGTARSLALLRRLRPAVVFSKGGFVSVPPVVAARLLGIPVVSHESDADPGLATRINARFSSEVLVAYDATRTCFGTAVRDRVRVTGNPLRPEILRGDRNAGLARLGLSESDERPVVLFLGGSLGARQINELVSLIRPRIQEQWRIVHQTGEHGPAAHADASYVAAPFFADELPDVLAAADILVCRAGASTLWEAAALAKPMLLVPLAAGSRGDQVRNAAIFEAAGAAKSFVRPERLASDVQAALDYYARHPQERADTGLEARKLIRLDAVERIADAITSYIREAK